jgi:hypothetical protein
LIMVCLSYLCNRRPRLNLKEATIAVVIAHRRKTKNGMHSAESFLLTGESRLARMAQNYAVNSPNFSLKNLPCLGRNGYKEKLQRARESGT